MPDRPVLARDAVHRVVYRDEAAFSSHPFLGGLWRVANGDLVVAFMRADCAYGTEADVHHDRITTSPRRMCTLRSRDGGRSWDPQSFQAIFETPAPAFQEAEAGSPFDLDGADTIVATGSAPALLVPEARAWMRISTDGGATWRPPVWMPHQHFASVSGHGSFTRRGDGLWLVGLTATSRDGWRRRPLLYASRDAVTWSFLAYVTPPAWDDELDAAPTVEPRFWAHRYMYPRPLALRDGRILATVRSQRDPTGAVWTEVFESADGGRTFRFLARVNDWGAPGDLVEMRDGRLVCVYGYRLPPYGIRASVSTDGGRSWGREIVLRDDGGSWDLGYPKAIELEDGRILAVYYMNLAGDPVQANGGPRHVASTLFEPG